MKDFKIIVTNNRQDFEFKIRQNLNDGYKMINSNLTMDKPLQPKTGYQVIGNAISNTPVKTSYELVFYAYMEKEI